jgi:hypothetical protein
MNSCFSVAVVVLALGAWPAVPSASAQGRGGMHVPAAVPRASASISRGVGREGGGRERQRRFLNDSAFLFPPYFYPWYEYDYGPVSPEAPQEIAPVLMVAPQPAPPAPAPAPSTPLLLENHDGQWVRIPTGNEIPVAPQPAKQEMASASTNARSGYVELPVAAPAAPLPPAVIVFRDGHTEEVAKYMIQGVDLYTTSDYYSTGSWTRKIPLSQLDIPASLKVNKERGTKFNLPSGPNEVVIRF